jgi:hypothetical protein
VLPARGAPRVGEGLVHVGEDLARALEQDLARRRELHPPGRAVQERRAELGLHPADVLGERRLGHVQARGGPAEVLLLGHRHEVPQVAQVHRPSLVRTPRRGRRPPGPAQGTQRSPAGVTCSSWVSAPGGCSARKTGGAGDRVLVGHRVGGMSRSSPPSWATR